MAASMTLRRVTLLGKVRTFRPLISATRPARARDELTLPTDNPRSSFLVNRESGSFAIDPFIRSSRYYAAIATLADLDVEKEKSPKLESAAGGKTFLERLRTETTNFIPSYLVTAIYKDLIGTKKAVSPDDALLLLGCFTPSLAEETAENRVKMAEKAFTDLKTAGMQFDVRHYNALLKVYLENGHPFDPEDFLLIISEDGIAMNEETYSLFVQRYCQTGNVSDAMKTLEFMKSKGIKMNRQLFHALIAGHLRIGDLDGVENLRTMLKKSYEETSQDFLPIISTYARMGNIDKVLDTIIDMKGLKLDCREVWSVLTAYMDWCIEENTYPEPSALDSLFDVAKRARPMTGFQSHLARTVVHLQTIGFPEIAVRLLTQHPEGNKMALFNFFKSAIRSLPFTDVSRYCDVVIEASDAIDPLQTICIPEMKKLPLELLQQILVDAKECDLSSDIISEVVKSKLPTFSEGMEFPTRRLIGPPKEKVLLLAIQLELPFVNDQCFWDDTIFVAESSFERLYGRLSQGASSLDKKLIESCKPTMINGFIQRCIRSKDKDRLKTIANLLRTHPDVDVDSDVVSPGKIGYRLCHKHDDAIEATLDDAMYLLSRMRNVKGGQIGSILFTLLKQGDAKLICDFIGKAKDEKIPLPSYRFFKEAFELVEDPMAAKALISYHDHCRQKDWIDTKVVVKLPLPALVRMAEGIKKDLLDELICVKAAAVCDERTALDALSRINPNRQISLSKSLVALIDMYAYGIGNVDEALKVIDRLIENCRDVNVVLSSATCLRIIELSIQNGKSLGDSILWDDLPQNFCLTLPYGNHDHQIVLDHIEFVTNLAEERDVIEAYLARLTNLGLGSSIADHHVALVLKNYGAKEAVELIKSYFNQNLKASDGIIPNEEQVLDAIVASEDVGLLKEFIDISYAVHGERNAFLSLAFALYKGGKYTQGKRILNIPGLRSDEGMVANFCNKMLMEKRHVALETFCEEVCCLYGTDESELSFFKLRSLICRDKLKALEYYGQLTTGPLSGSVTKKIQELGSDLYKSLDLEFTDKSIVVEDDSGVDDGKLQMDVASPLTGSVSQILRGIRNGEKFDFELYLELVTDILAVDPSPVVDALVDTENIPALEFLISSNVPVQSDLALVYIRQGRFADLLNICQGLENPECYLTATNLLVIALMDGTDQDFSLIEALAENEKSPGLPLLGNLVNYHLYSNNLEKATELLEKNPVLLKGSNLPLANINTYSPLLLLAELNAPSLDKRNLFFRMIMVSTTLQTSYLVEDTFRRMREANVDVHPSPRLRKRVVDVVGKDLFSSTMVIATDNGVEEDVDSADTIEVMMT